MACWRDMIEDEMKNHDDSLSAWVVKVIPADLDLDRQFDAGWGGAEGKPFTLWTADRVYFPACYDGSEWVESVPRHPSDEVTDHIGGG